MKSGRFSWRSFDTSIKELNCIMKINVLKEIRGCMKIVKAPNFHLDDLGAGSGRTASEMKQEIPNLRITATGLKKKTEWDKQKKCF